MKSYKKSKNYNIRKNRNYTKERSGMKNRNKQNSNFTKMTKIIIQIFSQRTTQPSVAEKITPLQDPRPMAQSENVSDDRHSMNQNIGPTMQYMQNQQARQENDHPRYLTGYGYQDRPQPQVTGANKIPLAERRDNQLNLSLEIPQFVTNVCIFIIKIKKRKNRKMRKSKLLPKNRKILKIGIRILIIKIQRQEAPQQQIPRRSQGNQDDIKNNDDYKKMVEEQQKVLEKNQAAMDSLLKFCEENEAKRNPRSNFHQNQKFHGQNRQDRQTTFVKPYQGNDRDSSIHRRPIRQPRDHKESCVCAICSPQGTRWKAHFQNRQNEIRSEAEKRAQMIPDRPYLKYKSPPKEDYSRPIKRTSPLIKSRRRDEDWKYTQDGDYLYRSKVFINSIPTDQKPQKRHLGYKENRFNDDSKRRRNDYSPDQPSTSAQRYEQFDPDLKEAVMASLIMLEELRQKGNEPRMEYPKEGRFNERDRYRRY